MLINITPANLAEQIIMYGVVHGVWESISWLRRRAKKEIRHIRHYHRRHRNAIIKNHVKADHGGRLKHCVDEACASLRTPVLPRAAVQPEQAGAHTQP
jgi:hypothetical protein